MRALNTFQSTSLRITNLTTRIDALNLKLASHFFRAVINETVRQMLLKQPDWIFRTNMRFHRGCHL
jgi:hypothetical protein